MTALLLDAFKSFDTDGSGSLERDEMVKCLESLKLGSTRLTAREVCFVHSADERAGADLTT